MPVPAARRQGLRGLTDEVVSCRACPRLVAWREEVGRERRAAFRDEDYWARPVPGFGDPAARLLVVGLAPAAHGGDRTGGGVHRDTAGGPLLGGGWRGRRPPPPANEGGRARPPPRRAGTGPGGLSRAGGGRVPLRPGPRSRPRRRRSRPGPAGPRRQDVDGDRWPGWPATIPATLPGPPRWPGRGRRSSRCPRGGRG